MFTTMTFRGRRKAPLQGTRVRAQDRGEPCPTLFIGNYSSLLGFPLGRDALSCKPSSRTNRLKFTHGLQKAPGLARRFPLRIKSALSPWLDTTAPSERHLWMITHQRSMSIVGPRFEVLSCRKFKQKRFTAGHYDIHNMPMKTKESSLDVTRQEQCSQLTRLQAFSLFLFLF